MSADSRPRDDARPRPPAWIVLFLAGPVIWYLYFWVVYLGAEAVCAAGAEGGDILGLPWISALVILATVVAAGPIVWFAAKARRVQPESGHRTDLARTGAMLGFVFLLATVFVGLPAVFLPPC